MRNGTTDPRNGFVSGAAVSGSLSVWTGAPDCWLEDLYVEQGARRRGLGAALVAAGIERAAARGCRRLELDVNEDNEAALALYRAMGFSTEPSRQAGACS